MRTLGMKSYDKYTSNERLYAILVSNLTYFEKEVTRINRRNSRENP